MVEMIQKGYRNPQTGFPDFRYRGREFDKMKWDNEMHDTDGDGVPNYLDADPLNAEPGTWGMRIQTQQPLTTQFREKQEVEEVQRRRPTPKRKKIKKSKKKK